MSTGKTLKVFCDDGGHASRRRTVATFTEQINGSGLRYHIKMLDTTGAQTALLIVNRRVDNEPESAPLEALPDRSRTDMRCKLCPGHWSHRNEYLYPVLESLLDAGVSRISSRRLAAKVDRKSAG